MPFHNLLEQSLDKGGSLINSSLFETPPRGSGSPLWERINRDPRYLKAKHKIQARYGLPLPFDIRLERKKWSEWMGTEEESTSQQATRGQEFIRDVHALFKKFEVPDAWYPDFIAEIAGPSSEEEK